MNTKLIRLLGIGAVGAALMPALAQSNYTIANPLIGRKEAKVDAPKPGVAIAKPTATPGRPLVRAVDDLGGIPSPVLAADDAPQSVGRVAGASGAKVNSLRDELSVYTATAILSGAEAVLRTNVGKVQALQAGAGGGAVAGAAAPAQSQIQQSGGGRSRSSPYHQDVLRVVHGQPLMINEMQVFPYVRDLQVDFTLGKGKPIFYSVVLDSETPPVYTVPAASREPVDATVEAKRSAMVSPSGASMPNSSAGATTSRP